MSDLECTDQAAPLFVMIDWRMHISLIKVREMSREVAALRSFNRIVTERIGVLQDGYLSRARPLGACRMLWEIGPEGTDARSLRTRLGLDSGYLSRLLQSLQSEGLISVAPDPLDARCRVINLTSTGIEERRALDRDSDALAQSLLDPLTPIQQSQFVEAAITVERLLTAGLVSIDIEDPASPDVQFCIDTYFDELKRRMETGFDPAMGTSADVDELTEPAGLLLVARLKNEPVGCGALKLHGNQPAEIKRLWVAKSTRGLGLGRRLLSELETHARTRGVTVLQLDTNSVLTEAVGLYRSAGYLDVEAFNDVSCADHWFEKCLSSTETP